VAGSRQVPPTACSIALSGLIQTPHSCMYADGVSAVWVTNSQNHGRLGWSQEMRSKYFAMSWIIRSSAAKQAMIMRQPGH
jgi:hypothetical protein